LTNIYSGIVGSYPRPQSLAKLVNRFNSGKITLEKLELGYEEHLRKLLKLLLQLDIQYLTDGMLRWDDIFNPLISYIDGVKVNGLHRFYDNNFFFRAPQVVGKISLRLDNPIPLWYERACNILREVTAELNKPGKFVVKPVLPGPLTLAMNSVNEAYSNISDLIHDYATEVLTPMIKVLRGRGASIIEVHEPELVVGRAGSDYVRASIDELASLCRECGVRLWIQTYFGDIRGVVNYLVTLSDNIIGVDLIATKHLSDITKVFKDFKSIALGVYDSRNTLLERNLEVRRVVREFIKLGVSEVYVTNNAPMDFIPDVIAVRKLRKLSSLVKSLRGDVT